MQITTNLMEDKLTELVLPYISSLFPGCIIGCANSSRKAIATFGTQDGEVPMGPTNLFDIASVTKSILNTLALKLIPYEELDQRIVEVLSMKGKYRDQITVRHLLSFGVEFGDRVQLSKIKSRGELIHVVTNGDLVYPPGEQYRYTNVSSMLLTLFLQAKFKKGFGELLDEYLLIPLSLKNTSFTPARSNGHLFNIVPTEKHLERGIVQDESARLYDEPTGSAGLFSTMEDILTFGQSFLGNNTYLPKDLIAKLPLSQITDTAASFGLGFGLRHHNECDIANDDGTPVTVLKKNGFSGIHLCILPENNFCYAVFGNICYYRRPNGEQKDKFTLLHKRLLRTLYESRSMLLKQ